MADKSTRRKFLTVAGASGAAALAGCVSGTGNTGTTEGGKQDKSNAGSKGDSKSTDSSKLKAGGSSTVYPITSDAASVWNSNPPADDEEYWGPGQYNISTDQRMADYWAGLYGFEPTDGSGPPFEVSVGLSHSGTGL